MKKAKRVLQVGCLVIGFLLLWFAVVRATSWDRAVRVTGEGQFSGKWDGTLRIGCYNIAHGRGGDPGGSNWQGGSQGERKKRLGEIADLIRGQDLDLVILNEVDFDCTWSNGVNQAQILAKECGYPFVVEQRNLDLGFPLFRVAIGNAILSRVPIREAEGVDYPAVKWWEPLAAGKKGGVKALVELPDGVEVEVFAVHAETRNAGVRKNSIKALVGSAGRISILAGDFNSVRGGDGATAVDLIFSDGRWKEVSATGATFPSTKPVSRIDWIFVPRGWNELSSKVLVRDLSDHAMVVGEWKVR
ncbi:MAG: endonuclease/exonuclease/phosphatase family protein [Akkermansiaceae bacterium]|nr:endonuclease/exonuclease/phosphatase family protein [Akkermansiaceae bacterium]